MTYGDLLDILIGRCFDLKVFGEGQVDVARLELAILDVEMDIAGRFLLDAYVVVNTTMFVTQANQDTYGLPDDFGRVIPPREELRTGIFVYDGSQNAELERITAERLVRESLPTLTSKPARFRLVPEHKIQLAPIPDSNNSANYTIRGMYIRRLGRHEPEDWIDLTHPEALRDGVLAQVTNDKGHPAAAKFQADYERNLARLGNAQGREHQQFQPSYAWRYQRRTIRGQR